MMVAAVAKLGRAFAAQVEALRKLKNGGSQFQRRRHPAADRGADKSGRRSASNPA